MSELSKSHEEQWWAAVQAKETSWDGTFFFGVVTTGVFCRPSCPARTPLRKNVRFYTYAEQAIGDGLRPCLRCHPLTDAKQLAHSGAMKRLCRFIREHADQTLTLETLAQEAKMSAPHLQKTFHVVVGVTPKEYADACRLQRLRGSLRTRSSVTEAILESGYGSNSRVYEKINTRLGMTPGEYRSGGVRVAISYAGAVTPLGCLLIGATDRGICFLQFGDDESALLEQLTREYPKADITPMDAAQKEQFAHWMQILGEHLAGESSRLEELPLDIAGTAFQYKVWRYLQRIPLGEVRSYTEVAEAIEQPTAARAVASACAANRVALAIPCHRVIRGSGELGGYRWGLERKRTLLDRERKIVALS